MRDCARTRSTVDVDVQVGVSQFRIDLAVRHRKNASIYVVGIECDGAAYHSTRSARDRDRLREDVLTSLGWKIIRVWSTDWFADPNGQTLRLVTEIERLEARRFDLLKTCSSDEDPSLSIDPSRPTNPQLR
jgi:very-short-patch-repair endonuclease